MSESLILAENRVGIIQYTLTDKAGALIDSSVGGPPTAYLHGTGNLLPGMEAALAGKSQGDIVTGDLAAKEAFGDHDGNEPQRVPRKELPGDNDWKPGMPLTVRAANDTVVRLWITKVQGAGVWITPNHPMAGTEVHYEVEVLHVREAKAVELEHGHAHGLDGKQGHKH
jgi:FKBP-type peptidyl-prolyl cis-trans isomerase SlyD